MSTTSSLAINDGRAPRPLTHTLGPRQLVIRRLGVLVPSWTRMSYMVVIERPAYLFEPSLTDKEPAYTESSLHSALRINTHYSHRQATGYLPHTIALPHAHDLTGKDNATPREICVDGVITLLK